MLRAILFWYVIPIAPAVLLAATWVQVIRSEVPDHEPFIRWVPHLIVTASELYYWMIYLAPQQVLGPDYSDVRYHRILANLLIALGIAIVLLFWKVIARWWLFAASLFLALTWLWVLGVQAVV